jgi:uncharacterized cupredoxin-like copper-binding protein
MNRIALPLLSAAAVAAFAVPVAAAPAASSVAVKLSDFKVTPAVRSARPGKVTFVVRNTASIAHELVVIKTPAKSAGMPMKSGAASENGKVGETEMAGGKTKRLTLTLKPGHYALICNIGSHYKMGMHADFTVR